jgi:hypothetical protein
MKVAVYSESPADEAAVRILVEAVLGRKTQHMPFSAPPGWSSVFSYLHKVLKHLHYNTDTEALVVVVDSDESTTHEPAHDQPNGANPKCRLCGLREEIFEIKKYLSAVPGRAEIKTAVGLAIPAIEAWYLCGRDPHLTEALIIQKTSAQIVPFKKQLKRDVYGTDRPSLELEMKHAIEEATRLATMLDDLETFFPNGFGPLARDVRNW